MSLNVLVLATTRLWAEGLMHSLAAQERVRVVGIAETAGDALEHAQRTPVDAVLVDMGEAGRLGDVRSLLDAEPDLTVIGLAVEETEARVVAGVEAGLSGYVPKHAGTTRLLEVVESVAQGEMPCSPRVAGGLLRRVRALSSDAPVAHLHAAPAQATPSGAQLTPREREILELIGDGLSNKEIATSLGIELPTVKNHVHRILDKLGVQRRGEAAALLRTARV